MSYLTKEIWTVVPKGLPKVRRYCPKCNQMMKFVNSEKFRVNANGRFIDIWMIYCCEFCCSTYNLTLYERCRPEDIGIERLRSFECNEQDLIREYAFNLQIHKANRTELLMEQVDYSIIVEHKRNIESDANIIEIHNFWGIGIRLDSIVSQELKISRKNALDFIEKSVKKTPKLRKGGKTKITGILVLELIEAIR